MKRDGSAVEHAFFFLRDPSYIKDISEDVSYIYTNKAESDPDAADQSLEHWRDNVIPKTGRPVRRYTADWNLYESTPEIALPLMVPTTAPRDSEVWACAFKGWRSRWETVGIKVDDCGEITGSELEKAKSYNQRFTSGRLGGFISDDKPLASIIIEELKNAIIKRFPEHMAIEEQTPLQKEIDQQAQFLRIASEGFIRRAGDFDAINDYLQSSENHPFAITAFAGMGKTSLLAHFIDTYTPTEDESLHYRFIGGSDDSVSAPRLLRSLLQELKEAGKIRSDIPAISSDMMNKLPDLLAESGQSGKTILIIDALNQLESGMSDLNWIPPALPENIKLIVSFKLGEETADEYLRQQKKIGGIVLHSVKPFENEMDRRALVEAYLEQYFKELDELRIRSLTQSEGAENPLFLKAALSELRVFGIHNDLSEVIRTRFGNTPVTAFNAILARMESDPAYTKLTPAITLPHMFGWITHSRYGLSIDELADLFIREGLATERTDALDAIYLILRQLRPFLAKRDGRIDFFYESFKIASTERYTRNHHYARKFEDWHRSLSEYFETIPLDNRHKLMEQAWQYALGGMEDKLKSLFFSYEYLDAYQRTLGAIPLLAEFDLAEHSGIMTRSLSLLRDCVRLIVHILTADPAQLAAQFWARMMDIKHPEIQALLAEAKTVKRAKREPWLRPNKSCLAQPGGPLICTLRGHIDSTTGVALTGDGRFAVTGGNDGAIRIWDTQRQTLIQTIPGPEGKVSVLAVTPDCHFAVSCVTYGKEITMWELIKGKRAGTLTGHIKNINSIALSADGTRAVSGSDDNTVRIWDTEQGVCLAVCSDHNGKQCKEVCVDMSADGTVAVSGGTHPDHALRVWDAVSGLLKKKLYGHTGGIYSVALSADGSTAVSASWDCSVRLWDVESGTCIRVLTEETGRTSGYIVSRELALSEDGKTALCGVSNYLIKAWDTRSGKELGSLAGHGQNIQGVALSADGKLAASVSWDETLKIWDLSRVERSSDTETGFVTSLRLSVDGALAVTTTMDNNTAGVWVVENGHHVHRLHGHTRELVDAVITPDNRHVITSSKDTTLKVWDIQTGACLRTIEKTRGANPTVYGVVLSPDGGTVYSDDWGGGVCGWDISDGSVRSRMEKTKSRVYDIIPIKDGRHVFVAAGIKYFIWDTDSNTFPYRTVHRSDTGRVAAAPNGCIFLSGTYSGQIRLWMPSENKRFIIDLYTRNIRAITVSADNRFAAAISEDGEIFLLDLTAKAYLRSMSYKVLPCFTADLTFDSDNRLLFVYNAGQISVWDTATGRCLTQLHTDTALRRLALLPKQRSKIVCFGYDGPCVLSLENGEYETDPDETGLGQMALRYFETDYEDEPDDEVPAEQPMSEPPGHKSEKKSIFKRLFTTVLDMVI